MKPIDSVEERKLFAAGMLNIADNYHDQYPECKPFVLAIQGLNNLSSNLIIPVYKDIEFTYTEFKTVNYLDMTKSISDLKTIIFDKLNLNSANMSLRITSTEYLSNMNIFKQLQIKDVSFHQNEFDHIVCESLYDDNFCVGSIETYLIELKELVKQIYEDNISCYIYKGFGKRGEIKDSCIYAYLYLYTPESRFCIRIISFDEEQFYRWITVFKQLNNWKDSTK